MIATISPSAVNGTVQAPAGKSAMQRACALALLNNGTTTIFNPGNSNDDQVAIHIIRQLGALVNTTADALMVHSNGEPKPAAHIDCGESGLSFRMFAPIVALCAERITLTGSGTLLNRPMQYLETLLLPLGVEIQSNNGYIPFKIRGPLIPADITMDGSMSSQYLTGILFAFAHAAKKPLRIEVNNLTSKPYIDLSVQMLQHFGYNVQHEQYSVFNIQPVVTQKKDIIYTTEGDWSAASFLLVAGAIAGTVSIKGLEAVSVQADRSIISVLERCGAYVQWKNGVVTVSNKRSLLPFKFAATDCPDLFPPLMALACYCNGQSVISGVHRLFSKESNRAESLLDVFTSMGAVVKINDDAFVIEGGHPLHAATVSSHNDHRIVMAVAVAALKAGGDVAILNASAVNKSYPAFFEAIKMLGAIVSLNNDN